VAFRLFIEPALLESLRRAAGGEVEVAERRENEAIQAAGVARLPERYSGSGWCESLDSFNKLNLPHLRPVAALFDILDLFVG